MKIGVYNRYWNTLGGGEKYIGSIAQCLATLGAVDLVAHEPFSISRLEKRLNLQLSHCRTIILSDNSNEAAEDLSSEYDLWVNGTYYSPARSKARRSILVVMFPFLGDKILKKLWTIAPVKQPSWVRGTFWPDHDFWRSYDLVAALSVYTQGWIRRWWSVKSYILPPPADLISCPTLQQKDIIISVGRFFAGGHNKKHAVMIEAFKEMCDSGICPSWEFHLCGGTHSETEHKEYLLSVIEKAKGYPIYIHPDISRERLEELYCQASVFWHAAGFGESERKQPERFEHFGITTVEAMSAGCVPVVIAKAGQKEIVTHGVNGYLWETTGQLKKYTGELMKNEAIAKKLAEEAQKTSVSFSLPVFSKKLTGLLEQIL